MTAHIPKGARDGPMLYDHEKSTLYGVPIKVTFDTSCFHDPRTRVPVADAIRRIESRNDVVVNFGQIDNAFLVCGAGRDGHAVFLEVCWECRWLAEAHKPGCRWELVQEVTDL